MRVTSSLTTLGRKNAIRFPFNVVRTLRAAQGDEIRGDLTNQIPGQPSILPELLVCCRCMLY